MRPALAVIVLALAAGAARADIGPLLPFAKHASVTIRIEVPDGFADYVCVVHRYHRALEGSPESNTASYEDLTPGRMIVLPIAQWEQLSLKFVPRDLAAAYPTARELGYVSGAKEYQFDWRETVPSWAGDEITITYRVQRSASGGIELVRTSWNPLWQWNVAAGLVTAAVVAGGVWFIRRKKRPASISPNPPGAT